MSALRGLRVLWNARSRDCSRVTWVALIALRPLPWPWSERILAACFRVKGFVKLRGLRIALASAAAQPGIRNRWRLALALFAYQGRFLARNSLLGIRAPEALARLVTVRGAAHLPGPGQGVILLGFHAGPRLSWLALRVAGVRLTWLGGRPSALWPPEIRARCFDGHGDLLLSRGVVQSVRLLRRAQMILRDGGTLFVNADGAGAVAFSVALPGRSVEIHQGWLTLRRLTGAMVLPVLSHLEGDIQIVTLHPPLPSPADDPAVDLEHCRRAISDLLIAYTRRFPEQCVSNAFQRRRDARLQDRNPQERSGSSTAVVDLGA